MELREYGDICYVRTFLTHKKCLFHYIPVHKVFSSEALRVYHFKSEVEHFTDSFHKHLLALHKLSHTQAVVARMTEK